MAISFEITGNTAVLTTESTYTCGEVSDAVMMAMDEIPQTSTLILDEELAIYRPLTEDILDTLQMSQEQYTQIRKIYVILSKSIRSEVGSSLDSIEFTYGHAFTICMDIDEAWADIEGSY